MQRHINDLVPALVDSISFYADGGDGGTGRCISLNKFVPVQFSITTRDGTSTHIKHADIDNLISALTYVKEHWGK